MASNYLKHAWAKTIPAGDVNQDSLYEQAANTYGSSLDRLARAYELDAEVRRDLVQEIHFQLWRSFALFDHRCSLRTFSRHVASTSYSFHIRQHKPERLKRQTVGTIWAQRTKKESHVAMLMRQAF